MSLRDQQVETDVLVLGGGMTGFRAALAARKLGARVTMAYRAKGASPYVIGFNAPLGDSDERDGPQVYFDDTVRGGYGLNDRRLVRLLADQAVDAYRELREIGVPFANAPMAAGQVRPKAAQRLLSGNTYPRSVFVPEGTGAAIMQAMSAHAREIGIDMISGQRVVDLLTDGDEVVGALLWKPHTTELTAVRARAVVMAMGGIGRLYADSTYPADVGADAFGMALAAGATLQDMEFVQFEPVVTVWPEQCRGMEMPTAMLGDGAHLINNLGERFMLGYNPPLGERGIEKAKMSLFIQREIDAGRGFPEGGVLFDTRVLPSATLESYVSHCRRLRAAGVDPAVTPPIVAPAAHSMMGGVSIDERGWSGVPGLYVGGEAAGGAHGASRIAGNGCSDTLVFGAVAGVGAADGLLPQRNRDWTGIEARSIARLASPTGGNASVEDLRALKDETRRIVSSSAGIWRNGRDLAAGHAAIDRVIAQIAETRPIDLEAAVERGEASRMALIGSTIIRSALARTESRGAHQRTDHPALDDSAWLRHVTFKQDRNGHVTDGLAPIR